MKTYINIFLILIVIIYSCGFDNNQKKKTIINQFISIPKFSANNFLCTVDTINYNMYNKKIEEFKYKIIIYADSINCIDCDLNLVEWKQRIKEIEKKKLNVCFLFILKSNYFSTVNQSVIRDNFHYPIFFDKYGYFLRMNNILNNIKFITFLLDQDDKIILIGNPINNDKVWNLFLSNLNKSNNLF